MVGEYKREAPRKLEIGRAPLLHLDPKRGNHNEGSKESFHDVIIAVNRVKTQLTLVALVGLFYMPERHLYDKPTVRPYEFRRRLSFPRLWRRNRFHQRFPSEQFPHILSEVEQCDDAAQRTLDSQSNGDFGRKTHSHTSAVLYLNDRDWLSQLNMHVFKKQHQLPIYRTKKNEA